MLLEAVVRLPVVVYLQVENTQDEGIKNYVDTLVPPATSRHNGSFIQVRGGAW